MSRMSSIGIGSGRNRRMERWVNIVSPTGMESRTWSMVIPSPGSDPRAQALRLDVLRAQDEPAGEDPLAQDVAVELGMGAHVALVVGESLGHQDRQERPRRQDGRDLDIGHHGAEQTERSERLLERLLDLGVRALEEVRAWHADAEPADSPAERFRVVGVRLGAW